MRAPIPLRSTNGLKNDKYTIAMARQRARFRHGTVLHQREGQRHAQCPSPDGHGYAVFGKGHQGTEVVDKIRASATSGPPYQNALSAPAPCHPSPPPRW